MKESVHLGQIRGIRVGIHWSLLVVAGLVVAGLADSLLPHAAPGHTSALYWIASLITAAVFYFCLLAHELAHALVARRRNIEVEGIVLWLLGGVSQLKGEAGDADSERRIAIAGPATSVVLAIGFFGLSRVFGAGHPASLAAAVFGWLGWINGLLAVFNLLPAFPLDGGRVLRSLLWRRHGDKRRATATAARAGTAFGYALMAVGAVTWFAAGAGLDGLWLGMVGWFLVSASRAEAAASDGTAELRGLRVGDVMTPNPLSVSTWVTLDQLMDEGVNRRRLSSFPVVEADGTFEGLVTLAQIGRVPMIRWTKTTTSAIARPAVQCVTCRPDDELFPVAQRIPASADHRAVVVDDLSRVIGIVSPGDLQRLPVSHGALTNT